MRTFHVILFFLLLFVLTGCWDRVEMNDVSAVTGIAIEKGENKKYRMTVSVINATELSQKSSVGDASTTTFTLEGNSVSELTNKMNVGMSRKLIFSHTRIVVIDEKIAKMGLIDFLDYLERSGEFRNDFNILISDNEKASDILKIAYPIQKDPSIKVYKQIQSFIDEWGGDPRVRLTDFISTIISKGKDPVAGTVTIKGDEEEGNSVENNKKLSPDAHVVISGLAIFKDDKMVGKMSIEDARSYLWTQKLKTTDITVPCGDETDRKQEKYIDVKITHSSSRMSADYPKNSDRPSLQVNVSGEGRIMGVNCPKDLTKVTTYQEFEKKMNQHIEEIIKKMIERTQQEYGLDIFGFGEVLNREHPDQFKRVEDNWPKEFKKADVNVTANYFIRRSGVRTKSFLNELEKKEK